jgi:hypothetical protein
MNERFSLTLTQRDVGQVSIKLQSIKMGQPFALAACAYSPSASSSRQYNTRAHLLRRKPAAKTIIAANFFAPRDNQKGKGIRRYFRPRFGKVSHWDF